MLLIGIILTASSLVLGTNAQIADVHDLEFGSASQLTYRWLDHIDPLEARGLFEDTVLSVRDAEIDSELDSIWVREADADAEAEADPDADADAEAEIDEDDDGELSILSREHENKDFDNLILAGRNADACPAPTGTIASRDPTPCKRDTEIHGV